jgi:hypothetical protein
VELGEPGVPWICCAWAAVAEAAQTADRAMPSVLFMDFCFISPLLCAQVVLFQIAKHLRLRSTRLRKNTQAYLIKIVPL